jgi:hypothetical protein
MHSINLGDMPLGNLNNVMIHIEYQDMNGYWRHFQTFHHQPTAFKTARRRAHTTGKRHRLISDDGRLLDLIDS